VAVIIADYEQVHKIFLEGLKVLSMFLKTTSSQIKKFSTLLNECDHTLSEWYFNKETTMALASINIEQYVKVAANANLLPKRDFYLSYDAEADIAYINFHNPARAADDSELTDDDVIIRYDKDEEIIGLTILHASKR